MMAYWNQASSGLRRRYLRINCLWKIVADFSAPIRYEWGCAQISFPFEGLYNGQITTGQQILLSSHLLPHMPKLRFQYRNTLLQNDAYLR